MADAGQGGVTAPGALRLLDLNAWLDYQLGLWNGWVAAHDEQWLALPTGNPSFPDLAAMFAHAFTPLHRYSDQVLGQPPVPIPDFPQPSWRLLADWARVCLDRHREACEATPAAEAERIVDFVTRSFGTLSLPAGLTLAHGATHCAWHLGGMCHLLRLAGIEPPQKSDMIFWLLQRD
jgi:uncharacterized damage-inducible protein DinB